MLRWFVASPLGAFPCAPRLQAMITDNRPSIVRGALPSGNGLPCDVPAATIVCALALMRRVAVDR